MHERLLDAFIPMDDHRGFQRRKPVRRVERRITPASRNGVCGVTQADRADSQRGDEAHKMKAPRGADERRGVRPMVAISGQGKKNGVHPLAQQESSATREEKAQATAAETSAPQQVSQETGIPPCEMAFRPLTRI